jgi:membrane-bound lytic murein transglycosylase D
MNPILHSLRLSATAALVFLVWSAPSQAHEGEHPEGEHPEAEQELPACQPVETRKQRKARKKQEKQKLQDARTAVVVDDPPPTSTGESANTTLAQKKDREQGGDAENNEDAWDPEAQNKMLTPLAEQPTKKNPIEPIAPADPLHFDKLDLAQFDIPIEDTPEVRKWLNWFITDGRGIYQRWLNRGPRYQKMMKEKLAAAGLPTDLIYLSMIESGYQIKATSHASAGGLWQFMPRTGKQYHLHQDYWVDERYDPEKALGAAITYLSYLHKKFGDWKLAWAAYNGGEGRIGRSIKTVGSDNFWTIARSKHLPAETKRYVPKIMATAILGHYPELYGFKAPEQKNFLEYDVTVVKGAVEIPILAKCAQTDSRTIKDLNPALKRHATPPTQYELRLPVGTKEKFVAALAKIPPEKRITYTRHQVRKGETLGKIAKKYKTSVTALMRANKIRNANRIYVGMKLTIPRGSDYKGSSSSAKTSSKAAKRPTTHKVRAGDSLSAIAAKYQLTVNQLKSYNKLSSSKIMPGQTLALKASRVSNSKSSTTSISYLVRSGDTLSQIAEKHRVRLSDLQRWNKISNAASLQSGQRLKIYTSTSDWSTYKVRAGDSLGLIATKNGCTVRELKSWNKLNSTTIHPGQRLRIRK